VSKEASRQQEISPGVEMLLVVMKVLRLVDTKLFSSDVVVLTYHPAGTDYRRAGEEQT
jgi:hypothetical protein